MLQLSFPGFTSPTVSQSSSKPPGKAKGPKKFGGMPDSVFFALRLEDSIAAFEARQEAMRLQSKHRMKAPPRRTDLLHVSLCSLGDHNGIPSGLVERADEAARSIEMPAFEVAFDQVMNFTNCIVLTGEDGVGGVRQLERALGDALETAKLGAHNRHFKPHVTLIYDRTAIPVRRLAKPVRWTVTEFVLIHSLIGKSIHVPLKTFPLGG